MSSVTFTNINPNFFYVWDPTINGDNGRGGYVTVDINNNSSTGTSMANKYVMPGQSFFVQTVNSPSGNPVEISFNESAKDVNASPTSVFSYDNDLKIDLLLYKTQSYNSGDSEADAIVINFNDNGNNSVDQMDASKIGNPSENLARLNNGNYLSIENRAVPVDDELLELYTDGLSSSDYTFVANVSNLANDVDVYILDNYTGNQTLLSDGTNQMSFMVDASIPGSVATDRFSLKFEVETFGVDDNELADSFKVYPNPVTDDRVSIQSSNMRGKATISLYNMIGQRVFKKQSSFEANGVVNVNLGNQQSGVYFIEINQKGETAKERLIIN